MVQKFHLLLENGAGNILYSSCFHEEVFYKLNLQNFSCFSEKRTPDTYQHSTNKVFLLVESS